MTRRRKGKSALAVCLAVSSTVAMATPSLGVMAAYIDPNASLEMEAANAQVSQAVASEGMILLENHNDALPLTGKTIALYGPGSYDTIRGGTGSGATYLRNDPITVWQGFLNAGFEIANSSYVEKMNELFQTNGGFEVDTMGNAYIQPEIMFTDEEKAEIEATDPSIPAVYVINRTSAEGADHKLEKGDYYLTDAEYQNLKTLGAHYENVIVVLNVGCVIDTSFFHGLGTPDYEKHDITSLVHDVTYEPGKYYINDGTEYVLAEGDYEEGTTYYSRTEDYVRATVTEDTFATDGSIYTQSVNYVPVKIENADQVDETKSYYTPSYSKAEVTEDTFVTDGTLFIETDGGYEAVTDGEYNADTDYYQITLYSAVTVDRINFAQFTDLYYAEAVYTPVAEDATYNAYTSYYQKGGYVETDVSSTFQSYVDAGCLYVKEGDEYRLVTGEDTYDSQAVYAEGYNTEKIEGLTALVDMGQGGMNGGAALVQCLSGEVPFSGKTVDTWAKNYWDYPSAEHYSDIDGDAVEENYMDDIYVGYRYFDTYGVEPAYPFGYGLTYTDFSINVDSIEANAEEITVNVTVTNTGDTAGKEVVEVYFSAPEDTDIDNPYQELAGYVKTENLEPGANQQVTVTFDTADLSSYNEAKSAYIIEDGDYTIRVGNSSRNTIEAATINVDEDIVTEDCENLFGLTKENMKEGTYDSSITMASESYVIDGMLEGSDVGITPTTEGITAEKASLSLKKAEFPEAVTHTYTEGHVTAYVSADSDYAAGENEDIEVVETSPDASYTLVDVANGDITMEQLVADMSVIELIDIVQGESYEGLAASSKDSDIIGYSAEMIYGSCGGTTSNMYNSRYIPNMEMVDGGAGVRINPTYQVYDAVPVDAEYNPETIYYTCQFSAWGGSKYNEITFDDADAFRAELDKGTRLYTTEGVTAYQYCTATPVGTVIAQTWNTELIEEQGRAVAQEMLTYGATLWLAPGMCIHRNPLCGRNFEYYSEDPLVAGKSAAAISLGVTTNEDGTATGISTMPKHFAVNSQESYRFGGNSMASERAIREIYLKGFEIAVKEAQPFAIMSSYNQVNGIPAYNNYAMLTEVLVNEWGFEGFVCTDWLSWYGSASCTASATSSVVPGTNAETYDSGSDYGVSGDDAYKTQLWQLVAGNSLEMPGQNEAKVITAWENGELRLGDLQNNAMRILNVALRSHQFDLLQEKLDAAGK